MSSRASVPEGAILLTTYADLQERFRLFAAGKINCLFVLGAPGIGKSEGLKAPLQGQDHLWIDGGRQTAFDFFCECSRNPNVPIVLDDADDVLEDANGRKLLQALTDTRMVKTLRWGSSTALLEKEGLATVLHTRSPAAIITNYRRRYAPLASRAHFFCFAPTPEEWYRYCGTWMTDQEVLDYAYAMLPMITRLDCRALVKAVEDKDAGLPKDKWRLHIDVLCSVKNENERVAREILASPDYGSKSRHQWGLVFAELTGKSVRTFERWEERLRSDQPEEDVERIVLQDRRGRGAA